MENRSAVHCSRRAVMFGLLAAPFIATHAMAERPDLADFNDLLKDIVKDFKKGKDIVDDGPLDDLHRRRLDRYLQRGERGIDQSLELIFSTGEVNSLIMATPWLITLSDIASFVLKMAQEAYFEKVFGSGDLDYIAARLYTIKHELLPEYRKFAGLK